MCHFVQDGRLLCQDGSFLVGSGRMASQAIEFSEQKISGLSKIGVLVSIKSLVGGNARVSRRRGRHGEREAVQEGAQDQSEGPARAQGLNARSGIKHIPRESNNADLSVASTSMLFWRSMSLKSCVHWLVKPIALVR